MAGGDFDAGFSATAVARAARTKAADPPGLPSIEDDSAAPNDSSPSQHPQRQDGRAPPREWECPIRPAATSLQRVEHCAMTTRKRPSRKAKEIRLSPHRQPSQMSAEAWQRALRRQFGREQMFEWRNLGAEPVFSDFAVHNPASGGHYRVTIRGQTAGDNRCSCPDYTTNDLGTCKHIEFVLGRRSEERRVGKECRSR